MDNWVLTAPRAITKQEQTEMNVLPTQVKVRVTHLLVSNFDALAFGGEMKISYPKTLGRFAIGVVTETGDECYGLTKGMRVFLESSRACRECLSCKSGVPGECTDVRTAVKDFDGFMRDFVICEGNDVAPIPDSVDDLHALCIDYVALAENIFDKLNMSAGSKIAIVGGGFFGSVCSQVALYHKLLPIVIDNNRQNIERLKRSGVFYAFPADDSLMSNINDATSGSLCDAAIYTSNCKLSPSIPARVVARNRDFVIGGFSAADFTIDAMPLFEKNLRIYTVSDGYDYTEAAINMLVHGALDLDLFEKQILSEFNPVELYTKRLETIASASKLVVLKFIM